MRATRTTLTTLITLAALVVSAVAGAAAVAEPGSPPHILEFEYSEDYEGIGRRHNAYATIKGPAERVTARVGGRSAEGRFDNAAGPKDYWDFLDRRFVRRLLDDLRSDGVASVKVKAVGETRTVRKRCDLVFEPDDQFGDYAGGDCDRI